MSPLAVSAFSDSETSEAPAHKVILMIMVLVVMVMMMTMVMMDYGDDGDVDGDDGDDKEGAEEEEKQTMMQSKCVMCDSLTMPLPTQYNACKHSPALPKHIPVNYMSPVRVRAAAPSPHVAWRAAPSPSPSPLVKSHNQNSALLGQVPQLAHSQLANEGDSPPAPRKRPWAAWVFFVMLGVMSVVGLFALGGLAGETAPSCILLGCWRWR